MNWMLCYLNCDLIIFLNELYIIDEIIKIIDYQLVKRINTENIKDYILFKRKLFTYIIG